jgi:succinyl-CoA synthetase beta subunit
MDLLEYQGKQLFARHGVPVPAGAPASSVEQAVAAADAIGYPCVIKAQVLIGGRGKAGGIKVAKDRKEAEEHAAAILGMDIRGKGTAAAKAEALEARGVRVGRTPTEVAEIAAGLAAELVRPADR